MFIEDARRNGLFLRTTWHPEAGQFVVRTWNCLGSDRSVSPAAADPALRPVRYEPMPGGRFMILLMFAAFSIAATLLVAATLGGGPDGPPPVFTAFWLFAFVWNGSRWLSGAPPTRRSVAPRCLQASAGARSRDTYRRRTKPYVLRRERPYSRPLVLLSIRLEY